MVYTTGIFFFLLSKTNHHNVNKILGKAVHFIPWSDLGYGSDRSGSFGHCYYIEDVNIYTPHTYFVVLFYL